MQIVLNKDDSERIKDICRQLHRDSNAKMVFLIDTEGNEIVSTGETDGIDRVSLATLTAGSIAATSGLAKLVGEHGFANLLHEGKRENINITLVNEHVIIAVIFDERTSLGLIRLRLKSAVNKLSSIFSEVKSRGESVQPFEELTDEDIDKLFEDK
jgi:predicted regulator of Ras-like GTPase activity (Roadblock/LC7/MglB family)